MNADAHSAHPSAGDFHEHELASFFANFAHYPRIALAVSGGADSVALMRLVRSWLDLRSRGPQITILTVDHQLREAAASEAAWVKSQAAALGFQHETLVWDGEKPRSGIQAAARNARYGLMTAYCRAASIPAIATAHTSDDQAETFIMRLARGSGLDGLAAMEDISRREGIDILRPLLMVSRRRIEAFLLRRDQPWLDDPSNDDERYERVRIRRRLKAGRPLGLSPAALALSARRLRRARDALDQVTAEFVRASVSLHEAGFARLRLPDLFAIHEDVALRALARVIVAVGGGGGPLRLSKIEAYYQMMRTAPRGATLGGCRLIANGATLTVVREIGRMEVTPGSVIRPGETLPWDGRFTVTYASGHAGDATLRALGADGIQAVKAAKGHFGPVPRLAAMTLPSLWTGAALCYAPFVDFAGQAPDGWSARSHAEFTNGWNMLAAREAHGNPMQAGS
jgi:tRNA(Ile)-lysidine synthase